MNHNIGAMFNGVYNVATGTKRALNSRIVYKHSGLRLHAFCSLVNDERNTSIVCNFGESLKVRYVEAWIAQTFDIDRLGFVINPGLEFSRIIGASEAHVYAQAGESNLELVVRTTVQACTRDNVVTRLAEGGQGQELSSLALISFS